MIARKARVPRGTLKPQWNIIENGSITNYPPHTITLDTDNRKNSTKEKRSSNCNTTTPITPTTIITTKKIDTQACKSLGEYYNNPEKIKQFCLEEKIRIQQKQKSLNKLIKDDDSTCRTRFIQPRKTAHNSQEKSETTTTKEKNPTKG